MLIACLLCFPTEQWIHDKAILMKWDESYNSSGRMGIGDDVPKRNFTGGDIGRWDPA